MGLLRKKAKRAGNHTRVASTQPQVLGIGIRERRRERSLGEFIHGLKEVTSIRTTCKHVVFTRIGAPEADVWNTVEKNEGVKSKGANVDSVASARLVAEMEQAKKNVEGALQSGSGR